MGITYLFIIPVLPYEEIVVAERRYPPIQDPSRNLLEPRSLGHTDEVQRRFPDVGITRL